MSQVERIFWATAATRTFASDEARTAYRERWLGRYLALFPSHCLLAEEAGTVTGYLAGCPDTRLEAATPLVCDLGYYIPRVLDAVRDVPAHFHVNVDPACAARGIGRALVSAFAGRCQAEGIGGLHVITAKASAAARFYEACGFSPRLGFTAGGRDLTLYAMSL